MTAPKQSWIDRLPFDPEMSKRSLYTATTPIPAGVTRDAAIEWLHDHRQLIKLNPLVVKFQQSTPPPNAPADEHDCAWYEITDHISYIPGGLSKGEVTYKACFNDLPYGVQTHVYAPAGLDIREKWSVGGSEPGEPREVIELGLNAPREGLYIREDVDMRCNVFLTNYVKRNLNRAHKVVIQRVGALAHAAAIGRRRENFGEVLESPVSPSVSRSQSTPFTPPETTATTYSSLYSGYTTPQNQPSTASSPCYCVGQHVSTCALYEHTPTKPKNDNWSPASDDKDLPNLPPTSGLHSHWHHIEIPAMEDLTPIERSQQPQYALQAQHVSGAPPTIREQYQQHDSYNHAPPEVQRSADTEIREAHPLFSAYPDDSLDTRPRPLTPQRLSRDSSWRPGLQPGAFI
jgi:hypothetical protein